MNKIVIQRNSKIKSLPSKQQFVTWANEVLSKRKKNYELVIRIVDNKESRYLNKKFRCNDKPTNIISFPFEHPPGIKTDFLGDLVMCAPLIRKEAKEQNKTFTSHWAHLTIHGVLHLLGYNHLTTKDAKKMEDLEIKHLEKLGLSDPYK